MLTSLVRRLLYHPAKNEDIVVESKNVGVLAYLALPVPAIVGSRFSEVYVLHAGFSLPTRFGFDASLAMVLNTLSLLTCG